MTNKRKMKKSINLICEELFAEGIAVTLYSNGKNRPNGEALLFSILKLQHNAISRVSHPEPGMPAKRYYRDLWEKFTNDASEIIDQINNMH
jgi:hypothetical protein